MNSSNTLTMKIVNCNNKTMIKDCIYGYVHVPSLCKMYMDVPEFQRLRRIKQLGNVSRVYPSATHTRFEHSIGVMHLAGVLCDILDVPKNIKNLIQLAGLYHDVGHLPYSHLFDRVLEILKPSNIHHEHEERSIDTFKKVSQRLNILTLEEQEFVCACISGDKLPGYPAYYFQMINNDIDVDRLDYLCRDAYHAGMPSFQANYILLNAVVTQDNTLGFREKAKEDVKNMFETRRRMHELVYQHPVCLEYETLYMCMILKLKDIDYDMLCDYKLETLLMTSPETKDSYEQLNYRHKNHDCLDCKAYLPKQIPKTPSLDVITWV